MGRWWRPHLGAWDAAVAAWADYRARSRPSHWRTQRRCWTRIVPVLRDIIPDATVAAAVTTATAPAEPANAEPSELARLELSPGGSQRLRLFGDSRGLRLHVLGASVSEVSDGQVLLTLDAEIESRVPIDIVLDLGQPEDTQIAGLTQPPRVDNWRRFSVPPRTTNQR